MKAVGVIIGSVAIAICFSSCTHPVVELDLSSGEPSLGQPAILEWTWTPSNSSPVDLVQVDGRRVDLKKTTEGGFWIRNLLKLSPGKHRIQFRGVAESIALHPEAVEFEAEAGKRYRVEIERDVNFKETDGKVATLYFNFASPVVFEVRYGTPVRITTGAPVPFKPLLDAEKNSLFYEEATLPKGRTARVYLPRRGSVYFTKISGPAGDARVEYREPRPASELEVFSNVVPPVEQCRLLPGEYRFGLVYRETLINYSVRGSSLVASGSEVRSTVVSLTLNAEAGHTYRINANVQRGESFAGTAGTNQFWWGRWNPVFEDVTGKKIIDE